ncbi:ubiquinol-cytochrome C reductase UQCRX/QCR9-like protein, partial [Laetiporus sulphureus 93-53]
VQLANTSYNTVVKRNSEYTCPPWFIFTSAYMFDVVFDIGITAFWDHWKIPQKQWKNICDKYVQ